VAAAAGAETAAVSVVNGANRAGNNLFKAAAVHPGRHAGSRVRRVAKQETTMETFKKRQKEMRRLERQRDKAAKRKEIKARKAAGITRESDRDTEPAESTAASDSAAAPSATDQAVLDRAEGVSRGDPLSRL
jgi:hypothetical protein